MQRQVRLMWTEHPERETENTAVRLAPQIYVILPKRVSSLPSPGLCLVISKNVLTPFFSK